MAKFQILKKEGLHYVKATLKNEMILAETGALSFMTGDIVMHAAIPSLDRVVNSTLAEESVVRPTYTGTGTVYLEPSFGGYYKFDLGGTPWILHSGAFWACDGTVAVNAYREKMLTSLWAGEGLIDFETRVSGEGQVVVATKGPVQRITLKDSKLVAAGKHVFARTEGIKYSIRRPTKTFLGRYLSGEGPARFYEGTGTLLVSFLPYWRYRMVQEKQRKRAKRDEA